jgi:hypothetical protein
MRLSRKQSNNATESPAEKLDKKTSKKHAKTERASIKPRFFTKPARILPIALSFYR